MADVENPGTQEATPLRPQRHVLMRRSTRIFDREPKSGVLAKTAGLCCSLACSLLVIAVFNILSVVSIVIGSMYLSKEHCPGQPNIAPVLIASGVLAIILSLLEGRGRVKVAQSEADGSEVPDNQPRDACDYVTTFLRTVKLVLFIYFCVIVYSLFSRVKYEPNVGLPGADGEEDVYCNPTLYLFSFWICTFVLASIGFALTLCCCFCCCLALCVAAEA